jgi:diaminohydroxyphosphoribosylaminopyrimidine deaminase/5-amino-6-(5-phosphoribosylamino)uracil reductase
MAFSSTPPLINDNRWMSVAVDQARRGIGLTTPNPPVGAVVVKDDVIIGQGYHQRAGLPHAEVEAIRAALARFPKLVQGSTIYVTLEPCSTHGRTPPCTEAIKAARIARVVYGAHDPNPSHRGRAEEILQASGIAVTYGVMEAECRELIGPFTKWVTTGIPYVIAKAGQSLDGRITRPSGESQWITSEAARTHGRRLRMRVDAIIVGAETVRRDNPQLTLRMGDAGQGKVQPLRVIMTRSGVLPADARVFTDEHRERTLVMPGLDFPDVLAELGRRGVVSVLVEGGGIILGRAFATQMVDEVVWYVAPRLCGGGRPSIAGLPLASSVELNPVRVLLIGDNVCFTGYPVWQK